MKGNVYIGYSTDPVIRYKATSGGVGSSIVKYLLDNGKCDYALSFDWDEKNMCYQPRLISDFSQYNICGSIYQEMDLIGHIKKLLSEQTGGGRIVLFSLPCQTRALRKICELAGFEALIIGLTCSSQQSKEATSYLLQQIGINEQDVTHWQYRGNGWPSGIQIETTDGKHHFVKNNGSIWTEIFHSRLFIQPRCYSCKNTLNDYADIALADPWLKEYVEKEKIGQTLFTSLTPKGNNVIEECTKAGYIEFKYVDRELLCKSQRTTIVRKKAYSAHPRLRKWLRKVFLSTVYKRMAKKKPLFKLHCKFKDRIERLIT